ncbi:MULTISPECIES: CDP-alcohol phosphatidyltransferase family protein [Nocardiopsis]|uniref:Phosphatidylglycerophosphate synthase n=1 Tax=Nocardiopsis sinuspersici TaxID=501010 RepID=A0A1V3BX51_9ACTN|nr:MULTISPECIES: CDP-alcohol phosphatidyltransferase family protein [Nocardiopsis]NYH53847.1 phosphatidylglycerophosphate synthase [Nocardiopsis sinuspersici]OOC52766.1 phosphatidylglycerophosphate synthase [Nocardiopsis sinuspersici]
MPAFTLDEVRARTLKERDSWWTVYLVDPVAVRLVRLLANRTSVTPNQLTVVALFLGLGAAVCFSLGYRQFLALGALLYFLGFLVDCVDGKLARLTGSESLFGAWMDYVSDRFRVLVCVVALMGGQYVVAADRSEDGGPVWFVWLALAVVFLDMLRYLNELQVYKVRREMRSHLAAALERARATLSMLEPEEDDTGSATGAGGRTMSDGGEQAVLRHGIGVLEQILRSQNEREARNQRTAGKQPDLTLPKVDLHKEFRDRFPWYQRFWASLNDQRVRTHLIGGIEFQMTVFVIAPLAVAVFAVPSLIGWITAVAGVLLLAFEIAIIYKLWLSTRDFFRVVDGIDSALRFSGPSDGAEEKSRDTDSGTGSQTSLR